MSTPKYVSNKQKQQEQELAARASQHKGYCEFLRKTLVESKQLCLIGITAQGVIERTFVTDIKGDNQVGAIAVRLCAECIDDGAYFPLQGIVLYHQYTDEETAAWAAKHAAEKTLKVV